MMKKYTAKQVDEIIKIKKEKKNRADRKLAEKHIWYFSEFMEADFAEDKKQFKRSRPHLMLMTMCYDLVTEKVINNMTLSLPPGSGKSYSTTRLLQREIGRRPDLPNMRNSYSSKLATGKLSSDVREDIMHAKNFKRLYPNIDVDRNRNKKEYWALKNQSQHIYSAAGVGGSSTGKDANNLLILDDEYSGFADALSEATSKRTYEFIRGVHQARKRVDTCSEIYCCTRWKSDDTIGKILSSQSIHKVYLDYEKWFGIFNEYYEKNEAKTITNKQFEEIYNRLKKRVEKDVKDNLFDFLVLQIPALINDGQDSFCEDIHSAKYYKLEKERFIEDDMEFYWQAEFMQDPIPMGGRLVTDLNWYEENKFGAYGIASIDPAFGGGDYFSAPIAVPDNGKYYIEDVVYSKEGTGYTIPKAIKKFKENNVKRVIVEKGNGEFVKNLREALAKYNHPCHIITTAQKLSKDIRVLMALPDIKRKVYFREDEKRVKGEYQDFVEAILAAPQKVSAAKHDDAPDSVALLTTINIPDGNQTGATFGYL